MTSFVIYFGVDGCPDRRDAINVRDVEVRFDDRFTVDEIFRIKMESSDFIAMSRELSAENGCPLMTITKGSLLPSLLSKLMM